MENARKVRSIPSPRPANLGERSMTYGGPAPSEISHSPSSFSSQGTTEKASVFSGFSLLPHGRNHGSRFTSQALSTHTAASSNGETPIQRGWPLLAHMMSETPELESFSLFRQLQVKNLLYYQVELAELEAELREVEKEDGEKQTSGKRAASYTIFAHRMIDSKDEADLNPEERKQGKLVSRLRQLLREYNAAILQHAKISALPQPDAHNVEAFRVWIRRECRGTKRIAGEASSVWGSLRDSDDDDSTSPWRRILPVFGKLLWPREDSPKDPNLVMIQPRRELDAFTRWIKHEFTPLWHDLRNRKETNNIEDQDYTTMVRYPELTMVKFTSFVATVVACILPIAAIAILTTATTTRDRLLYIGGFTILFAIGLTWFTEATTSRINIFTATAAFSAVLVVFVQNQ